MGHNMSTVYLIVKEYPDFDNSMNLGQHKKLQSMCVMGTYRNARKVMKILETGYSLGVCHESELDTPIAWDIEDWSGSMNIKYPVQFDFYTNEIKYLHNYGVNFYNPSNTRKKLSLEDLKCSKPAS